MQGLLRADLDRPLPERSRWGQRIVLRALHEVHHEAPAAGRWRIQVTPRVFRLRAVVGLHDRAADADIARRLRQRDHPSRRPGRLELCVDGHGATAAGDRRPAGLPAQGQGRQGARGKLPGTGPGRDAPRRPGVLPDQLQPEFGPRQEARHRPSAGVFPPGGARRRAGARPGAQAAQGPGRHREGPLRLHHLPRRALPERRHPQGGPRPGRRPGGRLEEQQRSIQEEEQRRGRQRQRQRGNPRSPVDRLGVLRRDRHQAPPARPRVVPGDRPPGALCPLRGLLPDVHRRPVPRGLRDAEELFSHRRKRRHQ
mmetsp:Transcript_29145/g.62442  ORF Transcript_29145/g.62442 Transcript_29145/m.62442 type:complete len:311 (+) Transcript_29145:1372-2304(+)